MALVTSGLTRPRRRHRVPASPRSQPRPSRRRAGRSFSGKVVTTVEIDGQIGEWASYAASIPALSGVHAVYLIARPDDRLLGDLSYLVVAFATRAQERGAAVLVLTAAGESPLAKLPHVTIVLPISPLADPGGVLAMGSRLAASAWGDGLAIVLMQISGYEWDRILGDGLSGGVARRGKPPRALPRLPDPSLRPVHLRPMRPIGAAPA